VTWRWVPVRGAGTRAVHHLVASSWPTTAPAPRYDTACGSPDARETVIEPDGSARCLACQRKILGP
jgi:hypothetical protein